MKSQKSNCVPRSFNDIFFLSFLYIIIMYNSQAQREKRGCDEMLVVSASIHLSHAVVLNVSTPHNLLVHGNRPPVPHYGPFIQSMNISQARNCWKKSAGGTSGFLAPLGISTQWTSFPTSVSKGIIFNAKKKNSVNNIWHF